VTDLRLTLLDENDEPVWVYALPVETALGDWNALEDVRNVVPCWPRIRADP
jgi:hypothetical protein